MKCYPKNDRRALRGRHLDPCPGRLPDSERPVSVPRCRGCEPCVELHCTLCFVTHSDDAHPRVCPECVGRVRSHLDQVVELSAMLRDQAANGGRDGRLEAARPIPGGEAMAMIGPSSGAPREFDDEAPPLLVLATWEDDWRLELNLDPGGRATISSCAQTLGENLTWAAQRHLAFDQFAHDLARLVSRLEDVLGAGERAARSVPCMHCGRELVRETRPAKECRCLWLDRPHWHRPGVCCLACRLEEEHAGHDQGGLVDVWVCRPCSRTFSEDTYRDFVATAYVAHSPTLTAAELAVKLGVKPNTIRQWAVRGHVARRGRDELGRTLYDVAGAEARHAELNRDDEEAG